MMNQTLSKPINLRSIISWCLFDWGNSAFPVIITTFVFSNYFIQKVSSNTELGTIAWSHTVTLIGLLVAILSPVLGAIADHQGRRKPWLMTFSFVCIIATGFLWTVLPNTQYIFRAQVLIILATTSLEVGQVFYNAMLAYITPPAYLGRVSGWGWGSGYLGGLVCLLIMLFLFIKLLGFGHLNPDTSQQLRIAGPLVALWFFVFAWPLFFFTEDQPSENTPLTSAIAKGLKTLWHTLVKIKHYKTIMIFLIAHMLYADALNTIFAYGGIVAGTLFHMSFTDILYFGLGMNLAAGIGAGLLSWLDDAKGSKLTIGLSLCVIAISVTGMLMSYSTQAFWIFGLTFSFCIGPVQAASRSLLVRITPQALITEMFGLYNLTGKLTAFLGPLFIGILMTHFHNLRIAMSSVIVFLIAGLIPLYFVKENG